jgi:hypothetical protein
MQKSVPVLEGLSVASPCTVSWDTMKGDDRVRHCGACRLNVFNLSEMSRRQAEDLIRKKEGRLCVRFYRRADGTVLTKDCPVGIRAIRRRIALAWSAAAALFLGAFAGGCSRTPAGGGGPESNPTTGIAAPPGIGTMGKPAAPPIQGDVAYPPHLQGEVYVPPKAPDPAPK